MSNIIKINKSVEIDNKVKEQTEVLNKKEHREARNNMNEAMDFVRKDYKLKDSNSQASAGKIVLTT
jgi:hypothetical protein